MFILDVEDSAFLVAQPPVHLDDAIEMVGKWIKISTYIIYFFSFINDLSYREAVENSVNYNTRLCIERRLRMPFLDTQTGIYEIIYIYMVL